MANKDRFIKVIDNFVPNFSLVRPLLDGVKFGDHVYKGKTYTGFGRVTLPLKKLIEEEMGCFVRFQQSHVRIGRRDTPLTHYIHSDSCDAQYAFVLYLNDPSCETGTMFWKHNATGLDRMLQPVDATVFETLSKDIDDECHWTTLEYVEAKANRAVIFDSSLFHSRYPKTLPIDEGDTPRMVCTIFFDKIEVPAELRIQEWDEIEDAEDFADAKEGNYLGLICKESGELARVYLNHVTSEATCVFEPDGVLGNPSNEANIAAILDDGFGYKPKRVLPNQRSVLND